MIVPLLVLAVGAIFSGSFLYNGFAGVAHEEGAEQNVITSANEGSHDEWNKDEFFGKSISVMPENDTVARAHHVAEWVKLAPTVAGVTGILLGYLAYMVFPAIPGFFSRLFKPLHILFFRKWFFDEIYHVLFVRTAICLGNIFWKKGDGAVIDGLGPNGFAHISQKMSGLLSRFQTGYVYQYAFMMMIGLISLVSWIAFGTNLFDRVIK
ncbi:MAG: NADH-quinone oxidoreductase subunit L, partial [Pseudomonadota bacterium]